MREILEFLRIYKKHFAMGIIVFFMYLGFFYGVSQNALLPSFIHGRRSCMNCSLHIELILSSNIACVLDVCTV